MCGRRDTFLCGTVGDRVLLLANHQSLLWNSKADKILKLKFIVKFIANAWATSNTWANLCEYTM